MIRLATNKDAPAIARVIRPVYEEYGFSWDEGGYMADIFDVEGYYFASGGAFWLWEEAGTATGVIGLEIFGRVPGNFGDVAFHEGKIRVCRTTCSLERLYVLPEARKAGVGSKLTEACLRQAIERGHKTMEIWSDKRLDKAHRLYQRIGAILVGERICDDPDESPEWGFVLDLERAALLPHTQ